MENDISRQANYRKSKAVQSVLIIIVLELFLFPFPIKANADESAQPLAKAQSDSVVLNTKLESETLVSPSVSNPGALPESLDKKAVKTEGRQVVSSKKYAMTAYNSEVGQCDESPCITANGFNVCKHGIEDTVAANFLPFGTEIRIPELFGDRIFVVRDRMNKRYQERVDVWFIHRENAIDFGVKYATIEVLKK